MAPDTRTVVIGAGIAGLGAARRIHQSGGAPVVFEAGDRVGGRIKTVRRDGLLFDVGAFIYLGSHAESIQEMLDVGIGSQMHEFDTFGAMPRSGELNFLDLNRPLRTLGTTYISARSKLNLARLMWLLARHWQDLTYTATAGIAAIDTDTVTSYCRRELNEEILDYIAAVVIRGPWLSDPSYASVGQLPWTLKNFFKPYFYGLDDGMDALGRAMAASLADVRLATPVVNVTDVDDHVEVTYTQNGRQRTDPTTYIMCSPREQPELCGVIVDHLKANSRCSENQGMITAFCRHEWCLEHLDAPDEKAIDAVLGFVEPYYGDLSSKIADYEIGRWHDVVPIMSKGRFKAVDRFMRETDPNARGQLARDLGPIPGVNGALVSWQAAGDRNAQQHNAGQKVRT